MGIEIKMQVIESAKRVFFFVGDTCGISSDRYVDNGHVIPDSVKLDRINDLPREFFVQCQEGQEKYQSKYFNSIPNFVIKNFAQWIDVRRSTITFQEVRCNGDSKIFKVSTSEEYMPQVYKNICLRIKNVENKEPWEENRQLLAQKLLFEAGIALPRYISGENWYIEPWVEGVQKCNDSKRMAEIVAQMHNLPTSWYRQFKTKVVEKLPILAYASEGSHVWPLTCKLSQYNKYKRLHKYLQVAGYEPLSAAGQQLVFSHSKVSEKNLISTPEGSLYLIGYENCCVQYAANELAYIFSQNEFGCYDYNGRYNFCRDYLVAMNMLSDDMSVRMLMFDVECAKLRCSWDSPLFKEIKDMPIKLFKDLESYTKLELFEKLARESDSIKAVIVDATFEKAYEMLSPEIGQIKDALIEFDDKVDEEMESWSKDLVVKLILEEKKFDENDPCSNSSQNKKLAIETIKCIGKVALCVAELKSKHR